MSTRFRAPAPPFKGPAFRTSKGANKPIRRIVIHSTVSECKRGGAEEIAAYFRSRNARGSAHYVVDPYATVQVVGDSVIAWHAPPNAHSIGIEMCEFPSQDVRRWGDKEQAALLSRTAHLTAQLCLAYGVRPYFVRWPALRLGRTGVTTHAEVSKAFRQSTHWDPGAWPVKPFMLMVRAEIKRLKAAAK